MKYPDTDINDLALIKLWFAIRASKELLALLPGRQHVTCRMPEQSQSVF